MAIQQIMLAGAGDPYWSSVVALLHMDGTNGSTTFTDATGKTWTRAGDAQISTAQSKFGGASGLFDGTGDWVDGPSSADFTFGTGDFTLELFARVTSVAANRGLISLATNWTVYVGSSSTLYVFDGSTNILGGTVGAYVINQWDHIAVARSSGTIRLFLNGALLQSASYTANMTSTNMRIGSGANGATNMLGNIDEVRITKGVARYTAAFTPPAAPFPNG